MTANIISRLEQDPERRRQGRPRQREREVGRERLLERTRIAMTRRPQTDIQRREIADIVGVTPALISYYFPDKWNLLEAAAHPIVSEHVREIDRILRSRKSNQEIFMDLIGVYLSFTSEHGYILDYYISSSKKLNKMQNIEMMIESHKKIVNFFSEGVKSGFFKNLDPEMMQAMLWSVCQYLGNIPESQHKADLPNQRRKFAEDGARGIVLDLFANGVLHPKVLLPHDPVDTAPQK